MSRHDKKHPLITYEPNIQKYSFLTDDKLTVLTYCFWLLMYFPKEWVLILLWKHTIVQTLLLLKQADASKSNGNGISELTPSQMMSMKHILHSRCYNENASQMKWY